MILVTGGAGFIGSHLVDKLLDQGYKVRVFDNLDPQVHGNLEQKGKWPNYCNPSAEYVFGDIRDEEKLLQAMKGVAVIYHLAAMVGVGQSMYEIKRYVDVNINGTAVLLNIMANNTAVRSQIRKVIVASSMSNYGEGEYECPVHGRVYPQERSITQLKQQQWEPICYEPSSSSSNEICGEILQSVPTKESKPMQSNSIYAVSKKTQEEMSLVTGQAYNIPTVALRYFNTYGTRQALSNPYTGVVAIFSSRFVSESPPLIYEDGRQIRDFVHVSDLVHGNIVAMKEEVPSGVYNVGSNQPITILNVARALKSHLQSPIEPRILNQYRAGDIRHCYADIKKLSQYGYTPQITVQAGMTELTEWVRQQKNTNDTFDQANTLLEKKGLTF